MTEDLESLCKQLHISGMFQFISDHLNENPGFEEFLISACKAELDVRLMSRQIRALKLAGFPTQKRFDDLLLDALPQDGRDAIPELKSLKFISEKKNVVMIGNSGTGKTHLAIATGVYTCENNYKVLFKTASGLINEFLEAKRLARITMAMKQFKKVDLLILDELGYVTFDIEGSELLFQLLAARHEIASTIITTNLAFSDWVRIFHDKTLTAALLDRITHRAMVLNMNGSSFRRRPCN